MPNHITNQLTILTDSPIKLKEIRNAIAGDEDSPYIDFEKIIPMPKCLHVTSGNMESHAKELIEKLKKDKSLEALYEADEDKFYESITNTIKKPAFLDEGEDFGQGLKVHMDAYKETGYTSWYNWCCNNWGTKWNAYSQYSENADYISFETAYSTPLPVMIALSKKFPDVLFTVEFADEDIGSNCGRYSIKKGQLKEEWMPQDDEAVRFACDVRGYDYNEYRQDQE